MGVRLGAALGAVVFALAVSAPAAPASVACPGDDQLPTTSSALQTAQAIVCDINAVRARDDLDPLKWDWRLGAAAQRHADDMAARHYVSHRSPDGNDVIDRVIPTGYTSMSDDWLVLENLGWATASLSTPLAFTLGWLGSPGHRANMLDPDIQDIGVGISFGSAYEGSGDGTFVVTDFGSTGVRHAAAHQSGFRRWLNQSCSKATTLSGWWAHPTTRTHCAH